MLQLCQISHNLCQNNITAGEPRYNITSYCIFEFEYRWWGDASSPPHQIRLWNAFLSTKVGRRRSTEKIVGDGVPLRPPSTTPLHTTIEF